MIINFNCSVKLSHNLNYSHNSPTRQSYQTIHQCHPPTLVKILTNHFSQSHKFYYIQSPVSWKFRSVELCDNDFTLSRHSSYILNIYFLTSWKILLYTKSSELENVKVDKILDLWYNEYIGKHYIL